MTRTLDPGQTSDAPRSVKTAQTVYIAGPMRGYPRHNFDAFFDAEADLLGQGYRVLNPARLDIAAGFDPANDPTEQELREMFDRDFDAISKSDGIVLLPGWENSEGVWAELRYATALNPRPYLAVLDEHRPLRLSWTKLDQIPPADSGHSIMPTALQAESCCQTCDGEQMVESPTGGRKGDKLARYDLIPVEPLRKVAEVYGLGSRKYADRNWERGYAWSLSYAALQRHLNAFWGGESHAPDDGQHHLASVVFHALALMEFERSHPEFDDRSKP